MTARNNVFLIVNADDYGLTLGTNRGIELAYTHGVVTSTSVMINQAASHQVADLGARCPDLGVGIHLTLTLGAPVSDPARVRSLIDANGQLIRRRELMVRLRKGLLEQAEVAREALAQLDRLRSVGLTPDHWDVHQHLQEYCPIGEAISDAMARAGLNVARNPMRLTLGSKRFLARKTRAFRARGRWAARSRISQLHRMPDALLDVHPARWVDIVPALEPGVVEAICHPGEADSDRDRLTGGWTTRRREELEALVEPELRMAICARGAELCTFARAFARA